MTDLLAALARATAKANDLIPPPEPEAVDDVLATSGDTYQRFNTAWRGSQRRDRESKEGSP